MSMRRARIGELLELQRRTAAVALEDSVREIGVRSFGRGLFIKDATTGADIGSKRVFWIEPGDLVVSNIFAWEGAVAVADDSHSGMAGSHRFMTWTAATEVDLAFIAHYFVSDEGLSQLRDASPGSAGRNRTLSIKNFEAIKVPLPPIEEQRRIAEYLGSLSQSLTRESPTRHRITEPTVKSCLQKLMDPFDATTPLGEMSTISRGVTPRLRDDGVGLIGQAAVRWEGIDGARLKGVDPDWEKGVSADRRTAIGDLLLNSTGEGTIGRACVVQGTAAGLITDSKVLTVRTTDALDPEFLVLFLRSPQGQAAIGDAKGASTTKQTELGVGRTSNLHVPVPALVMQTRIVDTWKAVGPKLSRLGHLEAQRQALEVSLLPAARNEVFSSLR